MTLLIVATLVVLAFRRFSCQPAPATLVPQSGPWYDDFFYDSQGFAGWTDSKLINGQTNVYHGVYGSSFGWNRKFQCPFAVNEVRVSYSLLFSCQSGNQDVIEVLGAAGAQQVSVQYTAADTSTNYQDSGLPGGTGCTKQWPLLSDEMIIPNIAGGVNFPVSFVGTIAIAGTQMLVFNISIECAVPSSGPAVPLLIPESVPWYDDFLYDSQGFAGWTDSKIIRGTSAEYHGVYASLFELNRYFRCPHAVNNVQVAFALLFDCDCAADLDSIVVALPQLKVTAVQYTIADATIQNFDGLQTSNQCMGVWSYVSGELTAPGVPGDQDFLVAFQGTIASQPSLGAQMAVFDISIECIDPTAVTPSPTDATPSPTDATPSPTDATPRPTDATPRPTDATPSPIGLTPSPTDATPSPIGLTPSPTDATPRPTDATPSPTDATPRPTDATPSPTGAPNESNTVSPTAAPNSLNIPSPTNAPNESTEHEIESTEGCEDACELREDCDANERCVLEHLSGCKKCIVLDIQTQSPETTESEDGPGTNTGSVFSYFVGLIITNIVLFVTICMSF